MVTAGWNRRSEGPVRGVGSLYRSGLKVARWCLWARAVARSNFVFAPCVQLAGQVYGRVMFENTYPPHLPFFFLDVPLRNRIPLFFAARFLLFVGALEIGFKDVLLIWDGSQNGGQGRAAPSERYR